MPNRDAPFFAPLQGALTKALCQWKRTSLLHQLVGYKSKKVYGTCRCRSNQPHLPSFHLTGFSFFALNVCPGFCLHSSSQCLFYVSLLIPTPQMEAPSMELFIRGRGGLRQQAGKEQVKNRTVDCKQYLKMHCVYLQPSLIQSFNTNPSNGSNIHGAF
jgi:hypothetical protein